VLTITILVYYGGQYYLSLKENHRINEYKRYASAISEVSLSAEIYRNEPDSFLIIRDSILNNYGLTIDSIDVFRSRLSSDNREWTEVWKIVQEKTDSLVDEYISIYHIDTSDIVSKSNPKPDINLSKATPLSDSLVRAKIEEFPIDTTNSISDSL